MSGDALEIPAFLIRDTITLTSRETNQLLDLLEDQRARLQQLETLKFGWLDRIDRLETELAAARAQVAALTALTGISDEMCLVCGGIGGHHEWCAGTTALIALQSELAALRDKALRFDLDQAGIERREAEAVELVELRAELAALRIRAERADKAEAEVARLNEWADGMTDAVLKERATGEMYQRELRAERDTLRAELAALRAQFDAAEKARCHAVMLNGDYTEELTALRAERDALRAEVEMWKERAYQLSHA